MNYKISFLDNYTFPEEILIKLCYLIGTLSVQFLLVFEPVHQLLHER